MEFPQNGFGTSEKKIRENSDEVYRMVRATLRGLQFVWDKNNQEAVTNVLMKQWRVNDRWMAVEMSKQVSRVLTKDAYVKPESVQVLIDLARESAKVTKPVRVMFVMSLLNGRAMAAGKNTAANEIIALSGGVNAIDGYEGYKIINDEAIVAAKPDVVLSIQRGKDSVDA